MAANLHYVSCFKITFYMWDHFKKNIITCTLEKSQWASEKCIIAVCSRKFVEYYVILNSGNNNGRIGKSFRLHYTNQSPMWVTPILHANERIINEKAVGDTTNISHRPLFCLGTLTVSITKACWEVGDGWLQAAIVQKGIMFAATWKREMWTDEESICTHAVICRPRQLLEAGCESQIGRVIGSSHREEKAFAGLLRASLNWMWDTSASFRWSQWIEVFPKAQAGTAGMV